MGKRTFLHDAIDFTALGVNSLENDTFSRCFKVNKQWTKYHRLIRTISIFLRYFVILPVKFLIFCTLFLLLSVLFVVMNWLNIICGAHLVFFMYMKLFAFGLGIRARHIGKKLKSKEPHIFVSNHTSFLDFVVLSSYKFHHAVISESHGGAFGFLFKFIISKNGSFCFRRSDKSDKDTIKAKIQKHLNEGRAPMIIFPEGTCVNNKHTLLFQKGAFEMGVKIYPVAINYKKTLLDPYWNRKKQGFIGHILYLITRWRIDAEVTWMPPVVLESGENPVAFSHRVKKLISEKANLYNTPWNGYFKSQLIHAEHDLFKLSEKNVFIRIKSDKFDETRAEDEKKKMSYLEMYRIKHIKENEVVFFNLLSRKQFYNECCIEFLRLKGLPKKEREIIVESMDVQNKTTKIERKPTFCTCCQ